MLLTTLFLLAIFPNGTSTEVVQHFSSDRECYYAASLLTKTYQDDVRGALVFHTCERTFEL